MQFKFILILIDSFVTPVTGSKATRVRSYIPDNAGLMTSNLIYVSVKVMKLGSKVLSVIFTEILTSTSQSS